MQLLQDWRFTSKHKQKSLSLLSSALLVVTLVTNAHPYPAQVRDISGKKYFPEVTAALSEAKNSVFVVMYLVRLNPHCKESAVYKLLDELVKAHQRGVEVEVILDQNIDFKTQQGKTDWQIEGKNAQAFRFLKNKGITVWYDDATTYTHSKLIVIDTETVILGSTNWTESAFFKNTESSVLIKSRELAEELLEEFTRIKKTSIPSQLYDTRQPPVPLSWKFLEDPDLGGKMLSRNDGRAFDIYLFLLLLREQQHDSQTEIILNYEEIATNLGIQNYSVTNYRRAINRTLRRLEKKYHIIKFKPVHGKSGIVLLTSPAPKKWYFYIPADYWLFGWHRILSNSAKYCYLINLAYASISDAKPWWFASLKTLSKRFNIDRKTISKGMQELRRLNIIDVKYDEFKGRGIKQLAKSYKILPLYDPVKLEEKWDRMKLIYGQDQLKLARSYASVVFKENDPEAVEYLLKLTKQYGPDVIKRAVDITAQKSISNPKRCFSYLVGIVKHQ